MRTDRRGFLGRVVGGLLVAPLVAHAAPAFSDGGVGTFGPGTLATPHGCDLIVSIDGEVITRQQAIEDYNLLLAAGVDPRALPKELVSIVAGAIR